MAFYQKTKESMKTEFGGEKGRNVIRFFINCQPKIIVRMIYLNKAIKRNLKNQMPLMLGHTKHLKVKITKMLKVQNN